MKKFMSTLLTVVSIFTMALGLSSCGVFFDTINAPEISVCGNVIYWNEVENAESYQVFVGEEVFNVTSNYYVVNENENAQEVYVVAKSAERVSKKSNKLSILKNIFSEDETIEITLEDNKGYSIPSNTNYVYIMGSAINSSVQIENRTRDLFIELDNVTLISAEGKSCISTIDENYDVAATDFAVIVSLNGINSLTGSDYLTVPSKPKDNSTTKGSKGGAGGSGIVLPKVAFTGSGSLSLYGGNGGTGGEGSDSTFMSSASNGSGGDGGIGGSGIKSTNILVALNFEGIIKTYGGQGGAGGKAGVNGSLWTGPWVDIAGSRPNGNQGNSGSKYIGDLLILGGTFN